MAEDNKNIKNAVDVLRQENEYRAIAVQDPERCEKLP